jgi:hypothetical protein
MIGPADGRSVVTGGRPLALLACLRARLALADGLSRRADGGQQERTMIRKLKSGEYRLYSRKVDPKTGKRRNLGTFKTRAEAEAHERAVQFFKRRG